MMPPLEWGSPVESARKGSMGTARAARISTSVLRARAPATRSPPVRTPRGLSTAPTARQATGAMASRGARRRVHARSTTAAATPSSRVFSRRVGRPALAATALMATRAKVTRFVKRSTRASTPLATRELNAPTSPRRRARKGTRAGTALKGWMAMACPARKSTAAHSPHASPPTLPRSSARTFRPLELGSCAPRAPWGTKVTGRHASSRRSAPGRLAIPARAASTSPRHAAASNVAAAPRATAATRSGPMDARTSMSVPCALGTTVQVAPATPEQPAVTCPAATRARCARRGTVAPGSWPLEGASPTPAATSTTAAAILSLPAARANWTSGLARVRRMRPRPASAARARVEQMPSRATGLWDVWTWMRVTRPRASTGWSASTSPVCAGSTRWSAPLASSAQTPFPLPSRIRVGSARLGTGVTAMLASAAPSRARGSWKSRARQPSSRQPCRTSEDRMIFPSTPP
mmetsp:Transcript_17611/g.56963  ORF Transcript_17611/g.56963 Transcript_17611/m.56963 type:complete len:464 (-) Transcript_17611:1946-3337(-)